MKKAIILVIIIMVVGGCAQKNSAQSDSPVRITTLIEENGGRVDWGTLGIVHSRYGEDGYYDMWIMNDDGSHGHCVTCDNPGISQLHNGQPAWHPSGEYIVFQSQDPLLPHNLREDYMLTQPGHGKHNNLWITDGEGTSFYQLTTIKENRAVLHPHFSHDGKKLVWSERIGDNPLDWAIIMADFVETPHPHLENVKSYQPLGSVWYETHDFSPDDTKVLLTIGTKEEYSGFDIYEMDIETQSMTQLTDNPDQWDEHAHYSPDGKKIVWASSHGYPYDPSKWQKSLKTELWIMDGDGSNKKRLTYFNEPGRSEYLGSAIAADSSWSPDGGKVVVTVGTGNRENTKIVLVEFTPEYLNRSIQRYIFNNSHTEGRCYPQHKLQWYETPIKTKWGSNKRGSQLYLVY